MMQVRYTKGRQLCYKEHIVNLYQDISNVASVLPRLPETIDIVIIRRDGVDLSQHIDFIVRREKVRDALLYKKAHDPSYADLEIDDAAIAALPENGTVIESLPICREGRQQEMAINAPGPQAAAIPPNPEVNSDSDMPLDNEENYPQDEDNLDEQQISGVLNLGNQQNSEVVQVREGANMVLQHPTYDQQHIVSNGYYSS